MSDINPYRGIPNHVRIGCYKFKVEVAEAEDAEADGTFGHMNPISQKIRVRPGMTPQNLANTFVHEVLHGIYWYHAIPHTEAEEEEVVTKMANGLSSFWQDNPAAVAWWTKIVRIDS